MKVIDLLNKIANNGVSDEIQHIKYFDRNAEKNDICMLCYENLIYKLNCGQLDINDEVEIIEEEKKIPEKIDYLGLNIREGNLCKKDTIMLCDYIDYQTQIINQLIDYLKSKGE